MIKDNNKMTCKYFNLFYQKINNEGEDFFCLRDLSYVLVLKKVDPAPG